VRAQFLGVCGERAVNASLDEGLKAFAERRLTEAYPYLILDARYEKVRESGIIVSQAVLVAVAVDGPFDRLRRPPADPRRRSRQPREPVELARLPVGAQGARPCRRRVRRFRRSSGSQGGDPRGLARGGLAALLCLLPQERARLRAAQGRRRLPELRWFYDRRDLAEVRRDLATWLAKWQTKYAKLCAWVEDNIEETLTYYRLPLPHHKHMKSTNMLERLNQELKRRTHVVRIFPNAESCLRLVRALAVETHENWLEATRYLSMDHLKEHKKEALRALAA
jgi:putative transposase